MNIAELMRLLAKAQIQLTLNDGKLAVAAPKGAMTAELMGHLKTFKPQLIDYLAAANSEQPQTITKVAASERLPLSFAQQRLWLLDQIEQGGSHYNMVYALDLNGELNIAALEQALLTVVERHHSLRTCFVVDETDGQPYQQVQSLTDIEFLQQTDLSGVSESERTEQIQACMAEQASQSFDLSQGLMIRAQLLVLPQKHYRLLVTLHHIASDGWSKGILIKEFVTLYQAYCANQPNPLTPLALQYGDYAHWQRHWLKDSQLQQHIDYWQQQLADLPVVHSLPLDRARPVEQSFNGASYVSEIGLDLSQKLNEFCLSHGATLFMGLHGVFASLLSKLSNADDIVLGTAVANRDQTEVADLIGFFINTLVLRADLSLKPSFEQLLGASKRMLLDAYAHQQMPFEQVVEILQPERNTSHSPLFQIMLVLQNHQTESLSLPGLEIKGVEQDAIVAKYDITLTITEHPQGLWLGWEYNKDLFDHQTIVSLGQYFEQLLAQMLQAPQQPVSQLPLLTASQSQQLLTELNQTQADFDHQALAHHGFEAQALAQPDAIALQFEQESLTYAQLNQAANQLAHYLIAERQVKPDDLVGICMQRSLDMVVAIVAVLKAGGGYVPLEPSYPLERLAYMLDDTQMKTVLTHTQWLADLPAGANSVCLDDEAVKQQLEQCDSTNPTISGLTSNHLAYVIYTSGSTGQPKGVMIEHQALVNRIAWMHQQYGCGSQDAILQKTPFSFDVSVWEFIWPLTVGAKLIVAKPEGHQQPQYLLDLITTHDVSKLHFVPSMLQAILQVIAANGAVLTAKQVFCSGEALPVNVVAQFKQLCPDVELHNLYGPTEAAIDVSFWDCADYQQQQVSIPIGKPIDNIQFKVVDSHGQLSAKGAPGELYIGGVGLARGYLNKPQLTATSFVSDDAGKRWYRSGDLVRWLADGNLAYLGRIDHQVKIRGFRIELGEIEAALSAHPQVEQAAVLVSKDGQHLVAYVVTTIDAQLNQTLSGFLAQSLPEHMVPQAYQSMTQLPVTSNGKLDRKALASIRVDKLVVEYVAPQTQLEQQLAQVWHQVLQLDAEQKIGLNDSFFALGGHSLLVMQVVTQLQNQGVKLAPSVMFSQHKLVDVAKAIAERSDSQTQYQAPANLIAPDCTKITPQMLPLVDLTQAEIDSIAALVPNGTANIQDIYPLGPLQQGILFHHLMHADTDPYVIPSLFRLRGRDTLDGFVSGLEFVIARHDVLRTSIIADGLSIPVQVVYREAPLLIDWLSFDDDKNVADEMAKLCLPERQWMDLTQGPLLKLSIGSVAQQAETDRADNDYYVVLQVHHIVNDAVSHQILQNEIMAFLQGEQQQLPTPVPYREYVGYALELAKSNDAKQYFTEQLADVTHTSAPFGLADVQGNGSDIIEIRRSISVELSNQIKQLKTDYQISGAAFFHSMWALVVGAFSGHNDVVFGTVLSGRLQGLADGLGKAGQMPGVFINTLPLRVSYQGLNAKTLFEQVEANLHQLIPHEMAALSLAQRCSGLAPEQALFSTMLNYRHGISNKTDEVEQSDNQSDALFEYLGKEERTNYPFTLGVTEHQLAAFELSLKVDDSIDCEQVFQCIEYTMTQLLADLRTGSKKSVELINVFKHYRADHHSMEHFELTDTVATILDYFDQQVISSPDKPAILRNQDNPNESCEEDLSYQQLNQQALVLAQHLAEQGVQAGDRVGLCVERSSRLIISIIAIWKLGAAYVPLEPDQPVKRSQFIIDDAEVKLVVTDVVKANEFSVDKLINLATLALASSVDFSADFTGDLSQSLAYVIYTSGTTGKPKGVRTTHANLLNFHHGFAEQMAQLQAGNDKPWLWHTSYAFDASVKGISLLFSGKPVIVASSEQSRDPQALVKLLQTHQVDVFNSTPKVVELVLEHLTSLTDYAVALICSGEDVSKAIWQQVASYCQQKQVKALNAYGPTEATINACYGLIEPQDEVNIGLPMAGIQALVLNEQLQPVPAGVEGELCLAGKSIADGYLARAVLTEQLFVDHEFVTSGKLYRSGDLVKQLSDGRLVYLGRKDKQVKLRGYRIELTEVEYQLSQLSQVKQAVVLVRAKASGQPQLVAFVVANGINDDIQSLKVELEQLLPNYAVPEAFVPVETIPLTLSGKVDESKLQLPELDQTENKDYVAPRNDIERKLVEIYQQVLQRTKVSVMDNFVKLGGDSILSMQVVSKAKREKIRIKVRHIFAADTLADLAVIAEQQSGGRTRDRAKGRRSKTAVNNNQVLLPVQQQFLAKLDLEKNGCVSHFNQSLFVNTPAAISAGDIEQLVAAIVARHEVLRLCFNFDASLGADGQWQGSYIDETSVSVADYLHVEDMSATDETQHADVIKTIGEQYQHSFDVSKGKLFKAVYFDYGIESSGKLLILAHHLIVDGVSWRVLIADLQLGYQQIKANSPVKLDEPTSSYAQWGEFLQQYANSDQFAEQKAYWQQVKQTPVAILAEDNVPLPLAQYQQIRFELSEAQTRYLVSMAPNVHDNQINQIMLSALYIALQRFSGEQAFSVMMEGHGREDIAPQLDLTETLGWFTTKYPMLLDLALLADSTEQILLAVKRKAEALPNNGIGYGLISPLDSQRESILFNYLGSFDQMFSSEQEFSMAAGDYGQDVGAYHSVAQAMVINGKIWQGKLGFSLLYDPERLNDGRMNEFCQHFQASFAQIIDYCQAAMSLETMYGLMAAQLDNEVFEQVVAPLGQANNDVKHNMFCAPPIGGSSNAYSQLAELMADKFQFYGLSYPGIYTEFSCESIELLATYYVNLIKRQQPQGPYYLVGWSSGGNIAYEIAYQLRQQGEQIAALLMLDQGAQSSYYQSQLIKDNPYAVVEGLYSSKIEMDWIRLSELDVTSALDQILQQVRKQQLVSVDVDDQTVLGYLAATYYVSQAMSVYQPQASDLDIELFRVQLDQAQNEDDASLGWAKLTTGQVQITQAQGAHRSMVFEPNVASLVASINERIS